VADVEQHVSVWDHEWDWSSAGDEWSQWWGGTPALWHGALLPRIHSFVPAPTMLEIAPGFGRWTQYLKDLAERLVIVDLAERCIAGCRERFADATNIEYHVNDGRSLAMVEDNSIDFAFSFDSLVHVDADVLEDYATELARVLAPDGVAFIHHSNLGAYRTLNRLTHRTPARLRSPLVRRGALIDIAAWRAEDVTADGFAEASERAGLACFSQETICWEHGRWMIDAISLLTRHGSRWARPRRLVRNPGFGREARRMAELYAAQD
jgi:SAM-dependent methyltransferase